MALLDMPPPRHTQTITWCTFFIILLTGCAVTLLLGMVLPYFIHSYLSLLARWW